jgi:hypothetical protein
MFTKDPGDVIHDVEWFYQGHSSEMVAILSHGTFVPLPAFSERVTYVPYAGIVIQNVITGDTGNYSIEISVSNAAQVLNTYRRSVYLEITGKFLCP